MLSIVINGERNTLKQTISVAELLAQKNFTSARVAVAVNKEFVPRSQYAEKYIQDGDQLEILSPIQGG